MNGEKLSCGIVLARRENDDWLTLLLRAYHHWDFPKGIVEDGEDPMHAALRGAVQPRQDGPLLPRSHRAVGRRTRAVTRNRRTRTSRVALGQL
jgi:hypothetical protein